MTRISISIAAALLASGMLGCSSSSTVRSPLVASAPDGLEAASYGSLDGDRGASGAWRSARHLDAAAAPRAGSAAEKSGAPGLDRFAVGDTAPVAGPQPGGPACIRCP